MFLSSYMGRTLLLCLLCHTTGTVAQVRDTAGVPPEIENPRLTGIHKEPAHVTLMPYGNIAEALGGNRKASSRSLLLNGTWKFHWVSWPQKRPASFYQPAFDVSGWDNITVPSNWQVQGYGTPFYSNFNYTFQKDFPRVMSTPPTNFTAFRERNPVGSYRRDFSLPQNWSGKRIFLTFEGVDAGFFLWINGHKVGYSVNSRNVAEFDVTDYVKTGKNMVAVEVYQYTAGSYLEDQDMWRLSGIFRSVYLWKNGVNLLLKDGGPRLHLWRAPHRNDDMWADDGWRKYGLKEIKWTVDNDVIVKNVDNTVSILVNLTGTGKENFVVHHQALYLIDISGRIRAFNHVTFSHPGVVLARMGVRMILDKSLDQFSYYGRGPMENYGDRKSGAQLGIYSGQVYQQLTPYEKPMEAGNHEDVRWATLGMGNKRMLQVSEKGGFMQVSALPYRDEELE